MAEDGNVICNSCGYIFWDNEAPQDENGIISCPACNSDDIEDYDETEQGESE